MVRHQDVGVIFSGEIDKRAQGVVDFCISLFVFHLGESEDWIND